MNTTMPLIVTLLNEDGPGPRDVLVVEETVLPMLLMPDVPVVLRDVREPISILQRFLLQAAVDAGWLDLREAHQATAIPIVALRRVAGEFARAGLFVADEQPDRFSARDELCRRSLAADRVELEKPGRLHFLYLPESEEVVALHMDGQTRKFAVAGGSLLRSRRFRDVSIVILSLLGSSCYFINQGVQTLARRVNPRRLVNFRPLDYLQWLPTGAIARAIERAANADWGLAVLWLLYAGALLMVVTWLWWRLLQRVVTGEGFLQGAPSTPPPGTGSDPGADCSCSTRACPRGRWRGPRAGRHPCRP